MMDLWDKLGAELNDIIGSHENNNVGWMYNQIYPKHFDEGGVATSDTDPSLMGTLKTVAKGVKDTYGGRQDTSALGGNFVNSPTYLMQHYYNAGKFFTGAESGNKYTDRYQNPHQSKVTQGEPASNFYAKWYETMRRFAEASEVANRGQTTVRSTQYIKDK